MPRRPAILAAALALCVPLAALSDTFMKETQLTRGAHDYVLTNANVFSPDGKWICYDERPNGGDFVAARIGRVNVDTGEEQTVYTTKDGAFCGVVTCNPKDGRLVFIQSPENPDADWNYAFSRRHGVLVNPDAPDAEARNLDAQNYAPPFAKGALRGGSHVHMFSADGEWASYTYDDEVLSRRAKAVPDCKPPQRTVAVCAPVEGGVQVSNAHPRSHGGDYFSVVAVALSQSPRGGSDDIVRACEEGWVGANGFTRKDGSHCRRALAFQGTVIAADGKPHAEVYIVELPEDLTRAGAQALEGTETQPPAPPKGAVQRRLTRTDARAHRGIQGVRHWLRVSPDGEQIAFLMRDDNGVSQIYTVSPNGGEPRQITRLESDVASAFTWSPDGKKIAFACDGSIFTVDAASGESTRLTAVRENPAEAPQPFAAVFSPDGKKIAFNRAIETQGVPRLQIFLVEAP